jgi:hypothetical protein
MWRTLAILLLAEAAKEYWDCHGLEDPATSGGFWGSVEDFTFWAAGNVLGVLVLLTARHFGHF